MFWYDVCQVPLDRDVKRVHVRRGVERFELTLKVRLGDGRLQDWRQCSGRREHRRGLTARATAVR